MSNALTVSPGLGTYQRLTSRLPRERDTRIPFVVFAFWAAHIPVALLMRQSNTFSTLHAFATVAAGLYFAFAGPKQLPRVAYIAAYTVGAEVLWRMTSADVFWEVGKWATAAVMIVAMLRSGRLKGPSLILWYFALLVPSIVLTLIAVGLAGTQRDLSFNLSGPFALMICCCFFSNLKLSVVQLQRLFLVQIGPILGVAAIALYGISTATDLTFSSNSSLATSGGFGPNQVSAVLGLGALLAMLVIMVRKVNLRTRSIVLLATVFLAVQSALTFSRGGLYNAVGAGLFASVYFMRDAQTRARMLILIPIVVLIVNYAVLPQLDSLTEGALSTRFKSVDTTNRADIVVAQLDVWREHPFLGVGPGQARRFAGGLAHTEMSRLVAEHGLLGLGALFFLLLSGAKNLRRARTASGKAVVAATIGWSFLFMLNAGMRLAAPSFLFGLSFLTVVDETDRSQRRSSRASRTRSLQASRAADTAEGLPATVVRAHSRSIRRAASQQSHR